MSADHTFEIENYLTIGKVREGMYDLFLRTADEKTVALRLSDAQADILSACLAKRAGLAIGA